MISKMTRLILPLLVLPLFVVACDDDGVGSNTAEVSLLLTDALGDHVDNVWIEIDSIYLTGTGGRTVLFDADVDAPDLGLVELTELGGDRELDEPGVAVTLIEDREIPAGTYGQLRFVIGSAVLESDGNFWSFNGAEPPEGFPAGFNPEDVGELRCPSCTQTGIKAILPSDEANIEAGSHIIFLDFDVGRSFGREAGASGAWVMSPVIVATELDFSGAIRGTVAFDEDAEGVVIATLPEECPPGTPADPADMLDVFEVTATAEGEEPLTADVDPADGSYGFAVLGADSYAMDFTTPRAFNTDPGDAYDYVGVEITVTPEDAEGPAGTVSLGAGTVVTVDYTINEVSCVPGG